MILRGLFLLLILISASHPIQGLLGIGVKSLYLALAGLAIVLSQNISLQSVRLLTVIVGVYLCGSAAGLVHMFQAQILGLLVLTLIISEQTVRIFNISKFYFALLRVTEIFNISAVIWLFLWMIGIDIPTLQIQNPETNSILDISIFGSTNSIQYLRPSGIFDEPGSLVFWNISVLSIGNIKGYIGDKRVIFNLILLLATSSFILVLILILNILLKVKKFSWSTKFFIFFILLFFVSLAPSFFQSRLTLDYLLENNRTLQAAIIYQFITPEILLHGWQTLYGDFKFGDISSVIWNIPFINGLVPTIVVIYLLINLLFSFTGRWFWLITFFLLVYQRPYFFNLYWSIPLFSMYLVLSKKNV